MCSCAVESETVDDRADDYATPHELADGVADILIVAAQPVYTPNHQGTREDVSAAARSFPPPVVSRFAPIA